VKALALIKGVEMATRLNINLADLEVEIDANVLINQIKNNSYTCNPIRNEWRSLISINKGSNSFHAISKDTNEVANALAREGRLNRFNQTFNLFHNLLSHIQRLMIGEKEGISYFLF
jgi:hypothetical protein